MPPLICISKATGGCQYQFTSSTLSSPCSGRAQSQATGVGWKHWQQMSGVGRTRARAQVSALASGAYACPRFRPGRLQRRQQSWRWRVAPSAPAVPIAKTHNYPKGFVPYWHEDWTDEPELRQFLSNNIGLSVGHQFRGSIFFYTFQYNEFLTLDNLWVDHVPTANEYSQLITPQAIYFIHQLFKRNLSVDLNWFRPWINTAGGSFALLFRTFPALGVRYVGGFEQFHVAGVEELPSVSFPRRGPRSPPGQWVIHEIPDVNLGNYSPTEVTSVRSAAEIVAALSAANFDFTRQVVLSTEIHDRLVPARDTKLSVIRGGLHFSGRSDGTSLVVLPLQYS